MSTEEGMGFNEKVLHRVMNVKNIIWLLEEGGEEVVAIQKQL